MTRNARVSYFLQPGNARFSSEEVIEPKRPSYRTGWLIEKVN
jgi:hypothetical protein